MNVCKIIEEAKYCAAKMADKYVDAATFGNVTDKLYFDLLTINAYIRTLSRNIPESYFKKEKVVMEGQYVDFSLLKKQNNYLILETKQEYKCTEVSIPKCLSDDDLQAISEQVKLLCNNCNCN